MPAPTEASAPRPAPAPAAPSAPGRRAQAGALVLAAVVVALDQLTKAAASRAFADGSHRTVLPGFFDLRLALNDGAAWSMLSGRRWLLAGVSAAMLALLAWNRRELCATRLSRIAAGLLAGGIVGNLLDRLRTGRVVDFLDWHWRAAYTFPTFNLADTAICIGVGLLVLASLPCFRARP